jgi:hypothetical protein
LTEAAHTYRSFGLSGRTVNGDAAVVRLPASPAAFLAAFTLNEMSDASRAVLLRRLVGGGAGDDVLVIEPLAGFVAPWWGRWTDAVLKAGGRADEWRFQVSLPPILGKLDRAAGLDHRQLTGRSWWIAGGRF